MDVDAFRATLGEPQPPAGLPDAVAALWWDAKGDWNKAHEHAQAGANPEGDWVHAYLHRKEGDLDNAGYWYRRTGKTMPSGTLESEWEAIARALLA